MNQIIQKISKKYNIDPAFLKAFIEVESGGKGFDSNGKILIQFEPTWFKKLASIELNNFQSTSPDKRNPDLVNKWNLIINNKISVQSKEWEAFNAAFSINSKAAMESTSIGLGQIMGLHWKRLGYVSVDEMWDCAKSGLECQIEQIVKFLITDKRMLEALKKLDFHLIATYYNGAGYKKLAESVGREPYNISLEKAYKKYKGTL